MKHDPIVTANATAVTVAFVYVVCAASIALFPTFSMMVASSWFHGIQLGKFGPGIVTPTSLVWGIVTATGGAWVVGYVFARAYNYFLKK